MMNRITTKILVGTTLHCGAVLLALASASLVAAQIDIHGPAGSVAFGYSVTVLPNGNFVVTDPTTGSGAGAVYLYSVAGNLISTLTGAAAGDNVGSYGIQIVGNSNFVVSSGDWNNSAGAVTWVNGVTGLNGMVSASNSLVGTTTGDYVGYSVSLLANGNYVVASPSWNNAVVDAQFGAATWGNGASGVAGVVSASNSLVGSTAGDQVGYDLTVLTNGNYVVGSPYWNNGVANAAYGAATWGNGSSGIKGHVSAANSLIGTTAGDEVGYAAALANGNYVVLSSAWNNGTPGSAVGAATWGNGATGIIGAVSAANSLIGTTAGDQVGYWGAITLTNGNYVVLSSQWNNGTPGNHVGAVTWGNGTTGIVGAVAAANSLIGTMPGDQIGSNSWQAGNALSNGNYAVASPSWNNGVGAATWGNGTTGMVGTISASNSLVGTTAGDRVSGGASVISLTNGNYVVCSPDWNNGVSSSHVGAATWGNGATGTVGAVSAVNSLIGTTTGDLVGLHATALSNGNYVVNSFHWNNGVANGLYGAVTWGNGNSGITGAVLTNNSLVGSAGDYVGERGVTALSNGSFVAASDVWNNGVANSRYGAVTWGKGTTSMTGAVSTGNSLVGSTPMDQVGGGWIRAFSDGNYLVSNPNWDKGGIANAGAVTLASGRFRLKGPIQAWNSVLGGVTDSGFQMTFDYDVVRHRLVVGRATENIVSLFTMDQIFAGDMEP